MLFPETKEGNVFVTDKSDTIVRIINGTSRPIVIIDDFQYIMANEFNHANRMQIP